MLALHLLCIGHLCHAHSNPTRTVPIVVHNIPPDKNIILTGFMGTGKTTVGHLLAQRLDRSFVDLDQQLEAQFGKQIPQIFAEEGEPAFRLVESQLCHRFAAESGIVLSTGGGALVNPDNLQTLRKTGIVICLTATVDTILERIDKIKDRPLLAGNTEERRHRIQELLNMRRSAYAAIPLQVDTTGLSPSQIVVRVLDALDAHAEVPGMNRIPVRTPDGEYHICVGSGILAHCGELMASRGIHSGPVAIVTNEVIGNLYAPALADSLHTAGFVPTVCTVPEGEQHKTLATISDLYSHFLSARMDRHSTVVALGGGVVGDMAGFAAATYLRGVRFVQVPVSLLAMVDASVGGKTGVDLPQGKNLVGAFKQPDVVVIDPDVFSTLPPAEFRSGLAEVVKHGVIDAPNLFSQLEEHGPTNMTQMLSEAIRVKVRIVEEDPFERGRRAVLNLGHTYGHAIELVSNFAVRHGEGVALGMVAATAMSHLLGRCDSNFETRIANLLDRLELPVRLEGYDLSQIINAMAHDKKRAGKTLRFVIPQAVGDVVVVDDPGSAIVRQSLEAIMTI